LKVVPSGAQSESLAHDREHALAMGMQPASVNEPRFSHERPAAHSPSVLQEMPAGLSELLLSLHAATADSAASRTGKATRDTATG
jgi:hypothetical protein